MKSIYKKRPCFGAIILIASLSISVYFAIWFIADSDDEQVHDALVEHGNLVVRERRKEAFSVLNEALATKQEGPLDPIWLQLVRVNSSGYEKLGYYMRILAGDPDREATYSEISNFIELAPKTFHDEVKIRYLTDMGKIKGINRDWLQKYGLVLTSNYL